MLWINVYIYSARLRLDESYVLFCFVINYVLWRRIFFKLNWINFTPRACRCNNLFFNWFKYRDIFPRSHFDHVASKWNKIKNEKFKNTSRVAKSSCKLDQHSYRPFAQLERIVDISWHNKNTRILLVSRRNLGRVESGRISCFNHRRPPVVYNGLSRDRRAFISRGRENARRKKGIR